MYILVALMVVFSWGLNAAMTKVGIATFPIFLFITMRFLGQGILFLPFSKKVSKSEAIELFKISMSFNVAHIGLIFLSLHYLTASSSAAIQQIQVPMAVVLSFIFLKEKISLMQVVGMFTAILGVVIIYGIPEVNFVGFIFTILSAFFFALTQILMKKSGSFHLPTFVSLTSLFSVPFLLALSLIFDKKLVIEEINFTKFLISLGYQVFVLGFSTAIWQKLVFKHGVNKITPINLLSVVFAILGGMVILGEELTYQIALGASVIVAGVALTIFFKPKEGIFSKVKNFILRRKQNTEII